jgi:hypothetical protein
MSKQNKTLTLSELPNEYKISSVYPNISITVSGVFSKCQNFFYLGVKMNINVERLDVLFLRLSDMKLIGNAFLLLNS